MPDGKLVCSKWCRVLIDLIDRKKVKEEDPTPKDAENAEDPVRRVCRTCKFASWALWEGEQGYCTWSPTPKAFFAVVESGIIDKRFVAEVCKTWEPLEGRITDTVERDDSRDW